MPATEEAAIRFEEKTGIKVNLIFGGSGTLLNQMILSKQGDVYFPGSSDFMQLAIEKGVIDTHQLIIIAYLIPAINVAVDNPENIHGLKDLTRPGLKIILANPESVCLGLYSVELLEKNLNPASLDSVKKNIIAYTESCSRTASALALGSADVILGWRIFEYWNPDKIKNIYLKKNQIPRIGYLPAALSKFCQNKKASIQFLEFLSSEEGKAIFRKHHYLTTLEDARHYTDTCAKVGGFYPLSPSWLNLNPGQKK